MNIYKRLKIGLEFLPILGILFRLWSIVHALGGINVAHHCESK